ncbi:uncharacterized protein [Watersipora subatra]|uniref:uncharacterized protein n=1 Tax=Watersipora subatra TaxID=2589382 RepID=UPI00355B8D87
MTKAGIPDSKPVYTSLPMPQVASVDPKANPPSTTCWYVCGLLSAIFCCLPFGLIGLVHAMVAQQEGEKGNYAAHRMRLRQAKCWTSWAIAIGLVTLIAAIATTLEMTVGVRGFCGYIDDWGWDGDWSWARNETSWNSTNSTTSEWMMWK